MNMKDEDFSETDFHLLEQQNDYHNLLHHQSFKKFDDNELFIKIYDITNPTV